MESGIVKLSEFRTSGYLYEVEFCNNSGSVTLNTYVNDQYKTGISSQEFFYPHATNELAELGKFLLSLDSK